MEYHRFWVGRGYYDGRPGYGYGGGYGRGYDGHDGPRRFYVGY